MSALRLFRHLDKIGDIPSARRNSEDWWRWTLAYALGGAHRFPLDVRLRTGEHVSLHHWEEASVLWQVFARPCYEVRPEDRIVIDAGANIGLFALWASKKAPNARIVCIEPHPETCERLLRLLAECHGRVEVVQCALAANSSPQWLYDSQQESSVSHYVGSDGDRESRRLVQATTLAELMEQCRLDRVDLLKMDIEGSEYDALLATPEETLRRIQRINVELHAPREGGLEKRAQLLDHLRHAGLKLQRFKPDRNGTGIAYLERE